MTAVSLLSGVTGAALWVAQSAQAGRVTPPPPMLTHFDRHRRHVAATVTYAGRQKLDIWLPDTLHSPAPVLVYIPGGAWILGHRRPQGYALMSHLLAQGWVCVSIDYRTAPLYRWPHPFFDVHEALAWVRSNIEDYGGGNFIAIAGASAGGHMASLYGLAWDHPDLYRSFPGFRPDAVIPLYGVYDWQYQGSSFHRAFSAFLELVVVGESIDTHGHIFRTASPITHVRPDAPPFFIVQGKADNLTPVGGARRFYRELSSVSDNCFYYELPHKRAGHGFDLSHPRATSAALGYISDFLAYARGRASYLSGQAL